MTFRKVIVSKPVRQELTTNGTGRVVATYPLVPQGEALFHQFGVSYEEFEAGPGNYTTAIIEWPDGRVESVPAEHVQFVVVMPIPAAPLCPLCNGCGLLGVGERCICECGETHNVKVNRHGTG